MTRVRRLVLACLALVVLVVGFELTSAAGLEPIVTGPSARVDQSQVSLGSDLRVTVEGFRSPNVTLAICGNEARRGSGDCNMTASMAESLAPLGAATVITMRVAAPPAPCPCLVRVSSGLDDEVAVAPFTIIGHPVATPVDSPNIRDPFALSIAAVAEPNGAVGWVRSSLGGPVRYRITATVKNRSTVPLDVTRLAGAAGRSEGNELVTFGFDAPGTIEPGQTWTQVVEATMPAPSFGTMKWRLTATTSGSPVTATTATEHRPWALLFLAMILVVDLTALGMRFVIQRRAASVVEPDEITDDPQVADLAA